MRQFANVSISPWANPYNGAGTNTEKSFYATAATPQQQPIYRRIVAPPPIFYNKGVEQVTEDEHDDQADSIDAPIASETPEASPALENTVETVSIPAEPGTSPPAPEPIPATNSIVELPSTAEADVASSSGDAIVEVVAVDEDVKNEPPGPSDAGDAGACAEPGLPLSLPTPPPPTAPVEASPIEPEIRSTVSEEQSTPAGEPAPPPPLPPPAPATDLSPESLVVVESGKSGESEQAAQEPPKSPTDKFVHFASDTKNPDAASIGKKKVQLAFGKGKANAFVRPKKPKPAAPVSPTPPLPSKDEKKKSTAPIGIMKKRERRGSILSVSSTEKSTVKEDAPTKPKLSKADERKKKKADKKSQGRKGTTDSSPSPSDEKMIEEEESPNSDVSDSVIFEETEGAASESIVNEEGPPPSSPPLPPTPPSNDTPVEATEVKVSENTAEAEEAATTDSASFEEGVSATSERTAESDLSSAVTSLDVQEPSTEEAPPVDGSDDHKEASTAESATEVLETATHDSTAEDVASPPIEPDAEPATQVAPELIAEASEAFKEETTPSVEVTTELEQVVVEDDVKAQSEAEVAVAAEPTVKENHIEEAQLVAKETIAIAIEDTPTPVAEEQSIAEEPVEDRPPAGGEEVAETDFTTDDASMIETAPAADDVVPIENVATTEEVPTINLSEDSLAGGRAVDMLDASSVRQTPVIEDLPTKELRTEEAPTTESSVGIGNVPAGDAASEIEEDATPEKTPAVEETDAPEVAPEIVEVIAPVEAPGEEKAVVVEVGAKLEEIPAIGEVPTVKAAPEAAAMLIAEDAVEETPATIENYAVAEQPIVEELSAQEEAPFTSISEFVDSEVGIGTSSPKPGAIQEESPPEENEEREAVPTTEQQHLIDSSLEAVEDARADEAEPSNTSEIETATSADPSPSKVNTGEENSQEDNHADTGMITEASARKGTLREAAGKDTVEEAVGETVEPQVHSTTKTLDTDASTAIDNGSSTSEGAGEGNDASAPVDNEHDPAAEITKGPMTIDTFDEADLTTDANANATDSSLYFPVIPEEETKEAVESEVASEAFQGETAGVADASIDTGVPAEDQGIKEAIASTQASKPAFELNEAVADARNESTEQDISDWEKDNVSEISFLADPSETAPSKQLGTESAPESVQEEEKAVELEGMASPAPPITKPVDTADNQETQATTQEKFVTTVTETYETSFEAESLAFETTARAGSDEVQDQTSPRFEELPASLNLPEMSKTSELPPTVGTPEQSTIDQDDNEEAKPGAGKQPVNTTTVELQEALEAEQAPDSSDVPRQPEPEEDATEDDAGVPQLDKPKPAEGSEEVKDSAQPVGSASPDDVVGHMETTADTKAEVPKVDDAQPGEACASITADATSEVSPGSALEQADINPPSEQAAVVQTLTVAVVSGTIVADIDPDHIDHDVAVAIVALAEAETSSAPDMPVEYASRKVLMDGSQVEDPLQPEVAVETSNTPEDDGEASQHSGSDSESESEHNDWSSSEASTHPAATEIAEREDAPAPPPAAEELREADTEHDIGPEEQSVVGDDASEAASSSSIPESSVVVVLEDTTSEIAEDNGQLEVEEEESDSDSLIAPLPGSDQDPAASSEVSAFTSEPVPESNPVLYEPVADTDDVSDITASTNASDAPAEDFTSDDMAAQTPSADEEIPPSPKIIAELEEEELAHAEVPELIEAPTEGDALGDDEADSASVGSEGDDQTGAQDAESGPDEVSEALQDDSAQAPETTEDAADAEAEARSTEEAADAGPETSEESTNTLNTEQEAEVSPPEVSPPKLLEDFEKQAVVQVDAEKIPADVEDIRGQSTISPEDADENAPNPGSTPEEPDLTDADEAAGSDDDQEPSAEPEATSATPATEEANTEDDTVEDKTPEEATAPETEPPAAEEPEAQLALPAAEDVVVEEGEETSEEPIEESKPDEEPEASEESRPSTAEEDEEETVLAEELEPTEEAVAAEGTKNEEVPPGSAEPFENVSTETAVEKATPVAPSDPEPAAEPEPDEPDAEKEPTSGPGTVVEEEPQPSSEPAVEAEAKMEPELIQEPICVGEPEASANTTRNATDEEEDAPFPNPVKEPEVPAPQEVDVALDSTPTEPEAIVADATRTEDTAPHAQEGVSDELPEPKFEGEPAEVPVAVASEEVPEAQQPEDSIRDVNLIESPVDASVPADLSLPHLAPAAASADGSQSRERDFAVEDEPATETTTREKTRRRHSQSQRDAPHRSNRRRESELSTKERPTVAGTDSATPNSKRRDSMTERDARRKERMREAEKTSSSSDKDKERAYPEYSSRHHRESRGEERHTKRRTKEEEEDEVDRQKRREARRAEKERLAAAEVARLAAEEEARKLEHRERRRAAKRAEEEILRAKEARRKLKEEERIAREDEEIKAKEARRKLREEEKIAQEEEERRMRHEKRRQRHEAEKELRRLEREKLEEAERATEEAKRAEEEARRLRRLRRAEREAGIASDPKAREDVEASRDAARRAAEEDDEPPPQATVEDSPRSAPRRRMSTRETAPNVKRGSLFGGIFGRSKPDAAAPVSKSNRPSTRARANTADSSLRPRTKPVEVSEDLVQVSRREKERPTSSHHIESSTESHDRAERPRRSRRPSNNQRRFKSAEEEEEYYKWKESRRYMRRPEPETSGGREGGISLTPPADDLLPPPPEPFDYGADLPPVERPDSPVIDDSAAVVGDASYSSDERRERRRSRRVSTMDERPKTRDRRISVVEKERPVARRIESDRPRTKDRGEDRPRARRGETERSSRRKKEEPSGGLFGRLRKKLT